MPPGPRTARDSERTRSTARTSPDPRLPVPGPDQKASINPDELRELVVSVREVEKLLGSGEKKVAPSEFLNRDVARKSLTTLCSIKKGDPFTVENLGTKRPGTGISALLYWEYLGKTADRDYAEDERIEPWRRQ